MNFDRSTSSLTLEELDSQDSVTPLEILNLFSFDYTSGNFEQIRASTLITLINRSNPSFTRDDYITVLKTVKKISTVALRTNNRQACSELLKICEFVKDKKIAL